ncbi:MAG: hypothetical protein Fur003_3070 [Candidatus Dojkabacteria bacterium]
MPDKNSNTNQYTRTFQSQAQQKIQERQDIIDAGNKIRDMQAELDRVKQPQTPKDKDRYEPTQIKKKSFVRNLLDAIAAPFVKAPEKSPEQLEKERKELTKKIEGLSVEDIIAPMEMEIDFNDVRVGPWYFRTLFVSGYPRFVGPNWLSPIINFEHSLRISTFYYPVDSKVILQKLKRKIGELEATLYSQMEGRKVVDPSLKVALSDAQQLQDSIAEGTEKFFHFGMYITIQAKEKEALEKISKNVISTLASMSVTAKPAILLQEQGVVSTQPLGIDKLFITRNMDTTSLATTFPFVTSELTMDHGIMYGINQHNRSLVVFDRFDMENANTVIFAKSGAGKSYYVKLEAIRSMMLGTEVIIIDPEKEFEPLCRAVNGAYISFSQDKGDKMNPFELSGLGNVGDDELRMKMLSLQGFFKLMLGELSNVEMAILDRALILTYREKGITLDPATQKNANYPLLEDLYKVLKGMAEPEARGMSGRLERYIIGSAAGVFNEPSTVELNNPFTVFSIRDMPDELRPMAMYLMLDYIWTKIRKDRKRRILIVEEAWYMMQNEDSAKFLYSIAKRARKYYLGLTTITQDVDDFLKTEMGRAIITNSAIQFLMLQSPTGLERLSKVFNLSEGEKQFLLHADKGQGLFFAGANHVAIQVIASTMEHELITTDPKDLERLKTRTGEDNRTIEELALMYETPAMQKAIKDNVDVEGQNLHKALTSRKSKIQELLEERIMVEQQAQQQTYTPRDNSLTSQVVAQRQEMNQGRTHLTPQGLIEVDSSVTPMNTSGATANSNNPPTN